MQPSVLSLLNQLEDLIASAPAIPIGGQVIIPRTRLLEFIDALRHALPPAVLEMEAPRWAGGPDRLADGHSR